MEKQEDCSDCDCGKDEKCECCSEEEREKLKEKYKGFKEKYSLPEFEDLAKDFDVEHIVEKETSFILRDIRKQVSEKCAAYLALFESLRNPTNAPLFILNSMKNLGPEDEEKIKTNYDILVRVQFSAMKLEVVYDEEKEAEFIKSTFEIWQEVKKEIFNLIEKFEQTFTEPKSKQKRGYFG